MVANLIKVKVYPKDLKAIPDILPFNKLICGEPKELELTKKEILRCMNFGDVFDMTSGEEVLIDEVAFAAIVEYVEETTEDEEEPEEEPSTPNSPSQDDTTGDDTVVDGTDIEQIAENTEKGAVPAFADQTVVTEDPVIAVVTQ